MGGYWGIIKFFSLLSEFQDILWFFFVLGPLRFFWRNIHFGGGVIIFGIAFFFGNISF